MSNIYGDRVKAVRLLMGLTREAFGSAVGIGYLRLTNIEVGRAKLSAEDLTSLTTVYPEITDYLLHGVDLNPDRLGNSKSPQVLAMANHIRKHGMAGIE